MKFSAKQTTQTKHDLMIEDLICNSTYLTWLNQKHPALFKFIVHFDEFKIRQKVYKNLYLSGFLDLRHPYVLELEDDGLISFKINASEMFRQIPFLYGYLKNTFSNEEQKLFEKYFSCYLS